MDGKSSASRSLIRGKSCSLQNVQESMQVDNQMLPHPFQGFMVSSPAQAQDVFSIGNGSGQKPDGPISLLDEDIDGNNESEKDKKDSPWQRVKWTDQMVKLLITAVSYIGEDASSDYGKKISPLLPKKGKWRAISKVMEERGFHVSPQQCEDKFNDLNKRYKKLNDMLGRGTCCEVVENPALLDLMNMSDKSKENVKKILNSKQLFYQEMCSYHNGNRIYIPHDHGVQKSLQLALGNSDEFHEEENDCPNDNTEEKRDVGSSKRKKPMGDENLEWYESRRVQLEKQRLQIEGERLELERQRLRWLQSSEVEDRELEKMRMENEYLKLDNERLALEIKRREMGN